MSTLAGQRLTNCQTMALSRSFAPAFGRGTLEGLTGTLRLWRQRMRERAELAALDERECRDIGASSADVSQEISQPFWRASARS